MKANLSERIVNRIIDKVAALKTRLPKEEYRKITNRLASLQRDEEMEDYFSDANEAERYNFGINPLTSHIIDCSCCSCEHCRKILGPTFNAVEC